MVAGTATTKFLEPFDWLSFLTREDCSYINISVMSSSLHCSSPASSLRFVIIPVNGKYSFQMVICCLMRSPIPGQQVNCPRMPDASERPRIPAPQPAQTAQQRVREEAAQISRVKLFSMQVGGSEARFSSPSRLQKITARIATEAGCVVAHAMSYRSLPRRSQTKMPYHQLHV